jgi:hypothetical protein
MAGVTAIQGVDDTLRDLSTAALTGLAPPTAVTVGPLDRDDDRNRLNWFLYRVTPNTAYANMESPRNGWRTARGRPPLALTLHYLLTSHAGALTTGGDEDQFAHRGLAAVMQALQANAIIEEADPIVSGLAKPLLEPLRITMESLDLEAVSKIWTAASQPLRLSVGYEVSLVIVDPTQAHVAGPPVRERRVAVAPTMGPRLLDVAPSRVSAGLAFRVAVEGLTATASFTLACEPGDTGCPPGGWPLTVVAIASDQVTLQITDPQLPPGERRLDVTVKEGGLVMGCDSIGLTLVPAVTGHSDPVNPGTIIDLSCAHAAPDVEVFLGGRPVASAQVQFVSTTQIQVGLPPATPIGPIEVFLRAGKLTGPPYSGLVVT